MQNDIASIPNDRIRADDSGVYVNDVAVTGFSRDFLTRFRREPQIVPEGHYFLMGEERLNQNITERMGIHPGVDLERVR